MVQERPKVNTIADKATAGACRYSEEWDEAVALLNGMAMKRVKSSTVGCVAALSAYERS